MFNLIHYRSSFVLALKCVSRTVRLPSMPCIGINRARQPTTDPQTESKFASPRALP
jgi:hypothetical protein